LREKGGVRVLGLEIEQFSSIKSDVYADERMLSENWLSEKDNSAFGNL